jgi:hypothetical protein
VFDECGICGGDNSTCADCAGVLNGAAVYDSCGIFCILDNPSADCSIYCDDDPSNDCVQDCAGVWGGTAVVDECGVCGGDGSSCNQDIYGCPAPDACNYNADATVDNGSCLYEDCSGECAGSAQYDECGICNGDGTSCLGSGDLNGDGVSNVIDIVILVNLIIEP